MSGRIIKRPRARLDLDEAAAFIQEQSGPERAIRFLRAAESTLAMLAGMPGMGTRYQPDEPLHAGLRHFPIARHRKFLVFDRPLPRRHRGAAGAPRGPADRRHPGGGIRRRSRRWRR